MNKKINVIVSSIIAGTAIVAGTALPVFADTSAIGLKANNSLIAASSTAQVTVSANRGNQEIARRIKALNAMSARVNAMQKISPAQKGSLAANIQTELTAMESLQTKINADVAANNMSALTADVRSITVSYRVFVLVIPQGAIEAAADRVITTANIMSGLSVKLSARISAAQAAGNNVSSSISTLSKLNAEVSDSNTKATAAVSEISGLSPDNGNAKLQASNTAALKDARAKVLAGQQGLISARTNAQSIIKALAKLEVSASASSSVQ